MPTPRKREREPLATNVGHPSMLNVANANSSDRASSLPPPTVSSADLRILADLRLENAAATVRQEESFEQQLFVLKSQLVQVHIQLLEQAKTVQVHNMRLTKLESKVNVDQHMPKATVIGHSARRGADFEEVRERQDKQDLVLQQLSRRAEEFNKIAGHLPDMRSDLKGALDRAAAVEMRQKSLEAEYLEQTRKMQADYLEQARKIQGLGLYQAEVDGSAAEQLEHLTAEQEMDLKKNLRMSPVYELNSSVWDLLLFIGTKELRTGASLLSMFLALFNVILQIGFVILVTINFTGYDIDRDDVAAAFEFRRAVGHDQRFMDAHSQTSLTERLCNMQFHSLQFEMAAAQREMLSEIENFLSLNESRIISTFNGQMMCCLALICWTLTIMKEYKQIIDLSSAAFQLPRKKDERQTIIRISVEGENTLEFENVHQTRFVMILLSLILRASIATNLLYCGCNWLATTMSVKDVLLNAIALEFIMMLDELVFEALAPGHAQALINKFKPLQITAWTHYSGVEIGTICLCAFVPVVAFAYYELRTAVMVQIMMDVKDNLCSGVRDFTYGTDVFNLVHLSRTPPPKYQDLQEEFMRKAVNEALQTYEEVRKPFDQEANLKYSIDPRIKSMTVGQAVAMSTAELVDIYNPVCKNLLDVKTQLQYQLYLEEVFQMSKCNELQHHCFDFHSLLGVLARLLCPRRCGCNRPNSDLPVSSPSFGCPSACQHTATWSVVRSTAPCYDTPLEDLRSQSYWARWVQHLNEFEYVFPRLSLLLHNYGCDFGQHIADTRVQDITRRLCMGTLESGLKSIAIACPKVCRCQDSEWAAVWCEAGPSSRWCQCAEDAKSDSRPESRRCDELICGQQRESVWPTAARFYPAEYEEYLSGPVLRDKCPAPGSGRSAGEANAPLAASQPPS